MVFFACSIYCFGLATLIFNAAYIGPDVGRHILTLGVLSKKWLASLYELTSLTDRHVTLVTISNNGR